MTVEIVEYFTTGLIILFGTFLGSFSGGAASLVVFPLLLIFIPGSYISLLITSKVAAAVMAIVAGKMHSKKRGMDYRLLATLLIGSLIGTGIGTYFLQHKFDESLFRILMTVFIFMTAFYLFMSKNKGLVKGKRQKRNLKSFLIIGFITVLINIMNGIFGGTGLFITILLVLYFRMSFIQAIAYTMVNYAIISAIQVGYLWWSEGFDLWMAVVAIIFAFIGGALGTKLQYLKGNLWVKRAAIIVMILIGVRMLF